jgi:DNA polymerase
MTLVPFEVAMAAWLEHLQDMGVEALRMPLPAALPARPRATPTPAPSGRASARPVSAAPRPVAPSPAPAASRAPEAAAALEAIRDDIGDCRRCRLSGGRTHIVFGVGSPAAELMFVGEGPGADEDAQGEPFVGRAGQLLTKIIEAMGMKREQVYIANVVKCRPPGNRLPEEDEVATCIGFLLRQIEAIRPRIIVTLGGLAAQTLLRSSTPISRLRGVFRDLRGTLVMPTFHPAFLLRNPNRKRDVWEDMQKVRDRLAEMRRNELPGRAGS